MDYPRGLISKICIYQVNYFGLVYFQVTYGVWLLSNSVCDAWVAADVMACTASILNLVAISVDR